MSGPNVLELSAFLAHQRPQDAQIRPLHHACIAREEALSPATQPAAHIGLPARAHGGAGGVPRWRGRRGRAPHSRVGGNGRYFGLPKPRMPERHRKS